MSVEDSRRLTIYRLHDEVKARDERIAELEAEIQGLREGERFYRKRCDELQAIQSRMRDPERQMVCDILANGLPRDKAGIGNYKQAARMPVCKGYLCPDDLARVLHGKHDITLVQISRTVSTGEHGPSFHIPIYIDPPEGKG